MNIIRPIDNCITNIPIELERNLTLLQSLESSVKDGTYEDAEWFSGGLKVSSNHRNVRYEIAYGRKLPDYKVQSLEEISALDLCENIRNEIGIILELYEGNKPIPVKNMEESLSRIEMLTECVFAFVEIEMNELFIPRYVPEYEKRKDREYDDEEDE